MSEAVVVEDTEQLKRDLEEHKTMLRQCNRALQDRIARVESLEGDLTIAQGLLKITETELERTQEENTRLHCRVMYLRVMGQ